MDSFDSIDISFTDEQGNEALCAECGHVIDLADCGARVAEVVDMPDGLPGMVFLAVCYGCANSAKPDKI